jgi:Tol biopolymer transport system component
VIQQLAVVIGLAVVAAAPLAHAQGAKPPKPEFATEIATSDSLAMGSATESPDGRWILFASANRIGPTHLWIMPAGGGAPRRLTDGNHFDRAAVWFPSGNRIAFASTRVHGVMTADIDPATGRLTSPLRRVSLEDAEYLDVSPDGHSIVYVDDRNRLRLIPAVGGAAVTLLERRGILMVPRFSRDGRDVYVSSQDPERKAATLLRVPVTGAAATTALTAPFDNRTWSILANPVHDRVVVTTPTGTSILTLAGDTIATMPPMPALPRRFFANFSRDGRRLYREADVSTVSVRVLPTAGGKSIDVTRGPDDYPLTWSADSKRLYSLISDTSITKSKRGLYVTAIDRTESRFLPMAEIDTALTGPWGPNYVSADARYWWFTPLRWRQPFSIVAYDMNIGQARLVTRTAMAIASGPGGYNVGPELFYVEQRAGGGAYELRSLGGTEPSRPIHNFSRLGTPKSVAVNKDRLAFVVGAGDSTVLYAARLMGTEQRLAAVAGGISGLSWSPDGRALAAVTTTKSPSGATYAVLFVPVPEDGKMSGSPRFVPTGSAWDLSWLPDSRGVLVLDAADHTRVLRVPMEEGQQPTSLSPNERNKFWDQYPSPDGRYVAIPVEQFGSSTLWSIDVEEATKAWRAKQGQR